MLFAKFIFSMISFIHWIGLYFYVWHLWNWYFVEEDENEQLKKEIKNSIIICFISWIISSAFIFAIIGIWTI